MPVSRYVVLLRGVNVGGVKMPMAEVRAALSAAGAEGVATVLASGNVLLDSTSASAATALVERTLEATFGYTSWVVAFDQARIAAFADAYPFDATDADWQPYVLFVGDPGILDELMAEADRLDPELERIALGDGVIYWTVRKGHTLDSAFGTVLGKKKFAAVTTSRNLRTLQKLTV